MYYILDFIIKLIISLVILGVIAKINMVFLLKNYKFYLMVLFVSIQKFSDVYYFKCVLY